MNRGINRCAVVIRLESRIAVLEGDRDSLRNAGLPTSDVEAEILYLRARLETLTNDSLEGQRLPSRLYVSMADFAADLDERIGRGEHPPTYVLSAFVRDWRWPLPSRVRDYVAGIVDGTLRRPRGRPGSAEWSVPDPSTGGRHPWERARLAYLVRRLQRIYAHSRYRREADRKARQNGGRLPHDSPYRPALEDPYRAALALVSKREGVPPERLDKYVFPRR